MFHNDRKARTAKRLFEAAAHKDNNPAPFYQWVGEVMADRQARENQVSIRSLFEMVVPNGGELVKSFKNNGGVSLMEAGSAIDTRHFSNITGQIVYSEVLDSFMDPVYIGNDLVTTVSTEFNGERIPGIGLLSDDVTVVGEGEDYPRMGTPEAYIDTPETTKRGAIVEVTKEAIFFDRTGLLLQRAAAVGRTLAINKEKRILDTVLGITTSYRRNGGAAQATYGDTHTNGDFDNLVASNALVDYTDVDNALLQFDLLTDPDTGEPIVIGVADIIIPRNLLMVASRVLEATGIEQGAIDANTPRAIGPNPLNSTSVTSQHSFNIKTNPYVKNRTGSTTSWFIGDAKKAFRYMENWPVTVVQAPANSEADFNRDIVNQYKVSERGTAAVVEPRYMVKCTA